jgi:hypothetical protein
MFRLLLELVIVGGACWLVLRRLALAAPRRASLEAGARWETHTESRDGVTSVLVRRVATNGVELGRQVIGAIPDTAPDWDTRYHEAMAEARSRLAAIKAQGA